MAALIAFFNALAAVPAIAQSLERFAAAVSMWYISRQNNDTLGEIADAAAYAARAKTPEDRAKSLDLWRHALARSRYRT